MSQSLSWWPRLPRASARNLWKLYSTHEPAAGDLNIFNFADNDGHLVGIGKRIQLLLEAESKRESKRPEVLAKVTWLASLYNRSVRDEFFHVRIPEVTPS